MRGVNSNTTYSEKKIDLISNRLSRIEACLERMPTSFSPYQSGNTHSTSHMSVQTPPDAATSSDRMPSGSREALTDQTISTDTIDATANAHSVLATKVLDQALGNIPVSEQHPALFGALGTLREMLQEMNENSDPTDLDITLYRGADEQVVSPSLLEIRDIIEKSCGVHSLLYQNLRSVTLTRIQTAYFSHSSLSFPRSF